MKKSIALLFPVILIGLTMFVSCQKETVNLQSNSNQANPLPLTTTQIQIQVSPNILNILSNGTVVTIHTNIPYSQVVGYTVELNGLAIQSWKSDNQGYFVAKFNMNSVKNLPGLNIGGYNTLTLTGVDVSDNPFIGSEDIKVVNNTPSGASRAK